MKIGRDKTRDVWIRHSIIMALAFLASAGLVWSDLIITNAAGVRAGITGIVRRPNNGIGVDFAITDPTGTNVTTFTIERSTNLVVWADLSPTQMVTGSTSGEASDFATSTNQFYRMRLINFH